MDVKTTIAAFGQQLTAAGAIVELVQSPVDAEALLSVACDGGNWNLPLNDPTRPA
jgi:hypothetical protein